MRLCLFLAVVLAFFLVFSSSAIAAIDGFPSTIEFFEKPVTINFSVSNTTSFSQRLSIEILAPVDSSINAPASLAAKETANVSITIVPKKEELGKNYETTLVVRIGSEEKHYRVRLIFSKADQENSAMAGAFSGFASFFATTSLELAVDIILIIIVIVLLVALVARIAKRI